MDQKTIKLAKDIHKLAKDLTDDQVVDLVKGLVRSMVERKQQAGLRKLAKELSRLEDKDSGVKRAKIYLANEEDRTIVLEQIKDMDLKLKPSFIVDKRLIAGARIETEDELIDGTIAGRLSKF